MGSMDWLPETARKRVLAAVAASKTALGGHLEAMALVGAAANPQRHDRAQAPEVLVLVGEITVDDLHRLGKALQEVMRDNVRVRVLTRDELEGSADVFAVEIAEYQAHHVMLHGEDPFSGIVIDKGDLRRSVEQGLRGLGRRVRNRVLAGVGSQGRREDPQRAAAHGLERFLVLCRQSLIVLGEEAPADELDVVDALAKRLKLKFKWVKRCVKAMRSGKRIDDPLAVTNDLLKAIKPLVKAVDAAEASA